MKGNNRQKPVAVLRIVNRYIAESKADEVIDSCNSHFVLFFVIFRQDGF
jgi:hypothetical protein